MRETDKQMLADHYLDLYRMAFVVLRNPSDVEDAVQEALTITMSRPLVRNPYSYCIRTLKSVCAKMLSRNLYTMIDQHPNLASVDDPNEHRLTQLKELIDHLPHRISEIFELYYSKGMTQQQIATAKGISESMVKKLIYRGHEQLRHQLLELENNEIFYSHE